MSRRPERRLWSGQTKPPWGGAFCARSAAPGIRAGDQAAAYSRRELHDGPARTYPPCGTGTLTPDRQDRLGTPTAGTAPQYLRQLPSILALLAPMKSELLEAKNRYAEGLKKTSAMIDDRRFPSGRRLYQDGVNGGYLGR